MWPTTRKQKPFPGIPILCSRLRSPQRSLPRPPNPCCWCSGCSFSNDLTAKTIRCRAVRTMPLASSKHWPPDTRNANRPPIKVRKQYAPFLFLPMGRDPAYCGGLNHKARLFNHQDELYSALFAALSIHHPFGKELVARSVMPGNKDTIHNPIAIGSPFTSPPP